MDRIAEYGGTFLNHLEGLFRPEDRGLAIALAEALGLEVVEMRFTENSRPLLAAHLNSEDKDPTNNVIFLYEMPEVQRRVMDLLTKRLTEDPVLSEAMSIYREAARRAPPIMPHFGIRYATEAELAAVMDRLAGSLPSDLAERVAVWEVPAYQPIDGLPDIRQVFVRTDVLTLGTAGFEQAIELQAERGK